MTRPTSSYKQIIVTYKGFAMIQTPWRGDRRKNYGVSIYNIEESREELHAGRGRRRKNRKQLKLELKQYVDYEREVLLNLWRRKYQ